jgi:ubiquinone/menaquinone biosynthesis C-methylase UbiE
MDQEQIYKHRAARYHQLVSAEDVEGNLPRALTRLVELAGRDVVEVGAGTGRLTKILLDAGARVWATEREPAMIEVARVTLRDYSPARLTLLRADARALPLQDASADIAIAGWVFGHLRLWLPDGWRAAVRAAVDEWRRVLRPGGAFVIIETMGTATTRPSPPSPALAEYYRWLVEHLGMTLATPEAISTDYQFPDSARAAELLGEFFGPRTRARIRRERWRRVPEFTAIWIGRVPPAGGSPRP